MPLPLHLPQDVHSVVVAQRPGHLIIVHTQVVLLNAPQSSQAGRIDDFEDACVLILPLDIRSVPLAWVVQQLLQKVPQQPTVS